MHQDRLHNILCAMLHGSLSDLQVSARIRPRSKCYTWWPGWIGADLLTLKAIDGDKERATLHKLSQLRGHLMLPLLL